MKRMYSAVPGRVYVATRAHSAIGDRELSLSKGDKVKGPFPELTLISVVECDSGVSLSSQSGRNSVWLVTELKVKHIHCIFLFIHVFLSTLSSVKCRRGGILGRNGQRPHRLVPLRLRRRGGQRQSIRYDNAIKLYSKVSIVAPFAIISLSFNQPESVYYGW